MLLPGVRGRIDHMTIDPSSNRLFVAERDNGTVDEVDLAAGRVVDRIADLHEPQGVAWTPATREILVACGDGLVRFFRGAEHLEIARISLGEDADNVRVDPRNGHLVVGYGSGGLAVIDPATHRILRRILLPGHPEAFAIDGATVFVNVPSRHLIVAADLDQGTLLSTIPTGAHAGNFPMAVDPAGAAIATVFRSPASTWLVDVKSGRTLLSLASCGDADDIYFMGGKLAVICGQGAVDLLSLDAAHPDDRIKTAPGARTGLLSADGKSLFIAVPAKTSTGQLWQLRVNHE